MIAIKDRKQPKPEEVPAGSPLKRVKSGGYYLDEHTGEKLRSVTTILSQGMPKEPLIYWAANLTAETALENLPDLVKRSRNPKTLKEAYDWLRAAHTRKRDARADIGSAIHNLIEAKVLGEPISPDLLDDPEMSRYLDHFLAFIEDFEVEFVASEMVVANYTDHYAGTLDYLLRSAKIIALINQMYELLLPLDTILMGDTKTGGELDEKGVWPEAGVQMSGYRKCEYGWLRDGSRVPLPATAEIGVVLHLRPAGYRLIPVRCGVEIFGAFLHAQGVAHFTSRVSKTVVGAPLHPGGPDAHELDTSGSCRFCKYTPELPAEPGSAPGDEVHGLCLMHSDGEYNDADCGSCLACPEDAPEENAAVEGAA